MKWIGGILDKRMKGQPIATLIDTSDSPYLNIEIEGDLNVESRP